MCGKCGTTSSPPVPVSARRTFSHPKKRDISLFLGTPHLKKSPHPPSLPELLYFSPSLFLLLSRNYGALRLRLPPSFEAFFPPHLRIFFKSLPVLSGQTLTQGAQPPPKKETLRVPSPQFCQLQLTLFLPPLFP